MTPLHIDFAPPSLRRTLARTPPLAWALLLVALLLCAAAGVLAWRLQAQRLADQAQVDSVRRRVAAPVVVAAAPVDVALPQISTVQANVVNAAVLQLNLPWRALRDAVGAATPPTIALLALEPDARKQTLRVTAEAKNSDEMFAYVEKLKEQELFSAVLLTRHEINDQDPNRPIRFQLDAIWSAP
jgi:Tfp pilus assembly protein PilN